jgi:hypothetical protein
MRNRSSLRRCVNCMVARIKYRQTIYGRSRIRRNKPSYHGNTAFTTAPTSKPGNYKTLIFLDSGIIRIGKAHRYVFLYHSSNLKGVKYRTTVFPGLYASILNNMGCCQNHLSKVISISFPPSSITLCRLNSSSCLMKSIDFWYSKIRSLMIS